MGRLRQGEARVKMSSRRGLWATGCFKSITHLVGEGGKQCTECTDAMIRFAWCGHGGFLLHARQEAASVVLSIGEAHCVGGRRGTEEQQIVGIRARRGGG
mmetsp:Transcript_27155/g.55341  ORF Transcript_27155/g.55341 Transcript_27155/m.55341 type:complete len:100 (+) Transcript_27155:1749-2048(+)